MQEISEWAKDVLYSAQERMKRGRGMFLVEFDNRKKHGRYPIQKYEAEGTLYSSGHIHIDTTGLRVTDFTSFQQMLDYLSEFGSAAVVWLDDPGDEGSQVM